MAKKLYRVREEKTDYRVVYVWADTEEDIRPVMACHSCRPSWEPEGYTWHANEVKQYEYENVRPGRVLNPEDEE